MRESYYHTTHINSKIEHRLNLQCVRESYYHTTLINSISSWPLFNVFLVTGPSDQLHNSQIMHIIQGNILEDFIILHNMYYATLLINTSYNPHIKAYSILYIFSQRYYIAYVSLIHTSWTCYFAPNAIHIWLHSPYNRNIPKSNNLGNSSNLTFMTSI